MFNVQPLETEKVKQNFESHLIILWRCRRRLFHCNILSVALFLRFLPQTERRQNRQPATTSNIHYVLSIGRRREIWWEITWLWFKYFSSSRSFPAIYFIFNATFFYSEQRQVDVIIGMSRNENWFLLVRCILSIDDNATIYFFAPEFEIIFITIIKHKHLLILICLLFKQLIIMNEFEIHSPLNLFW